MCLLEGYTKLICFFMLCKFSFPFCLQWVCKTWTYFCIGLSTYIYTKRCLLQMLGGWYVDNNKCFAAVRKSPYAMLGNDSLFSYLFPFPHHGSKPLKELNYEPHFSLVGTSLKKRPANNQVFTVILFHVENKQSHLWSPANPHHQKSQYQYEKATLIIIIKEQ